MSSLASRTRRERVTFNDVISGNVSEDILTASTPVAEKVYELERVESSCQTDELPVYQLILFPSYLFLHLPLLSCANVQCLLNQLLFLLCWMSPLYCHQVNQALL